MFCLFQQRFSFIMQYEGGTYIAQVLAKTKEEALLKWAEQLDPESISGLTEDIQEDIIAAVKEEELTPLDGLKSIWCATFLPADASGIILLNIVLTK